MASEPEPAPTLIDFITNRNGNIVLRDDVTARVHYHDRKSCLRCLHIHTPTTEICLASDPEEAMAQTYHDFTKLNLPH